jgi:signal transduction histidine kinase
LAGVDYQRLKTVLPETLADMHNASRRIKAIVDDLTHFISKEESTIEFEPYLDLNQLVQTTVRLMSKTIEKSTNHFDTDYDPTLPTFEANGQRIEQVIINLLLNACQALSDPGQTIMIKTRYDRTNQAVIFTINDTGVGIDSANLSRITDPFYTSKRSQGGTGLGLSVSAGIIRDHQGTLEFHSTIGHGTKVSLSLPLKQG